MRAYRSIQSSTGIMKKGAVVAQSTVEGSVVTSKKILNATDGEIYSARAVELDGVADRVLDGLNLGTTVTRVVLLVKRATTGTFRFRLQSGVLSSLAITKAGVWQELEWAGSILTANSVTFGWNGNTYIDCQLADIRLYNGETLVARYLCNEHADTEGTGLNGLPCLDSSGNGNHGSYVGCTGVAGIGVPEELRGLREYGEYMWFDGVDDSVSALGITLISDFSLALKVYMNNTSPASVLCAGTNTGIGGDRMQLFNGRIRVIISGTIHEFSSLPLVPFNTFISITLVRVGTLVTLSYLGQQQTIDYGNNNNFVVNQLGARASYDRLRGILRDIYLNGTLIATGKGTTSAAWGGGTVVGNPNTIGQLRRTPPQVAGMGWNAGLDILDNGKLENWINVNTPERWSFGANIDASKRRQSTDSVQGAFSLEFDGVGGSQTAGNFLSPLPLMDLSTTYNVSFWAKRVAGEDTLQTGLGYGSQEVSHFNAGEWEHYTRQLTSLDSSGFQSSNRRLNFGCAVGTSYRLDDVRVSLPNAVTPASPSNPTQDALGTPISIPRPNPSVLNHSPTDYTFIPNPGPIRSITFFAYNQGQTVKLADLGTPEIGLAGNTVTTSGITGPQVYVDTTLTTTVPPGWHMITVQSTTPFGTSDWEIRDRVGHLISYEPRVLKPEEIQRNFNANHRQYPDE